MPDPKVTIPTRPLDHNETAKIIETMLLPAKAKGATMTWMPRVDGWTTLVVHVPPSATPVKHAAAIQAIVTDELAKS